MYYITNCHIITAHGFLTPLNMSVCHVFSHSQTDGPAVKYRKTILRSFKEKIKLFTA